MSDCQTLTSAHYEGCSPPVEASDPQSEALGLLEPAQPVVKVPELGIRAHLDPATFRAVLFKEINCLLYHILSYLLSIIQREAICFHIKAILNRQPCLHLMLRRSKIGFLLFGMGPGPKLPVLAQSSLSRGVDLYETC